MICGVTREFWWVILNKYNEKALSVSTCGIFSFRYWTTQKILLNRRYIYILLLTTDCSYCMTKHFTALLISFVAVWTVTKLATPPLCMSECLLLSYYFWSPTVLLLKVLKWGWMPHWWHRLWVASKWTRWDPERKGHL